MKLNTKVFNIFKTLYTIFNTQSIWPFPGSLLRPAQLKPTINPFLKVTNEVTEEPLEETDKQKEPESTEGRLKEDTEAPKFMPLAVSNVTSRNSNPVPAPAQPAAASSASFVFGQNLSERVVIKENVKNGDMDPADHSSSNGTSELLFTSAAATVKDNQVCSCTLNFFFVDRHKMFFSQIVYF